MEHFLRTYFVPYKDGKSSLLIEIPFPFSQWAISWNREVRHPRQSSRDRDPDTVVFRDRTVNGPENNVPFKIRLAEEKDTATVDLHLRDNGSSLSCPARTS